MLQVHGFPTPIPQIPTAKQNIPLHCLIYHMGKLGDRESNLQISYHLSLRSLRNNIVSASQDVSIDVL